MVLFDNVTVASSSTITQTWDPTVGPSAYGHPVFSSQRVNCETVSDIITGTDAIETYEGASGLQYLGNGEWQFNWNTQKIWAGTGREITLNATGDSALFKFK